MLTASASLPPSAFALAPVAAPAAATSAAVLPAASAIPAAQEFDAIAEEAASAARFAEATIAAADGVNADTDGTKLKLGKDSQSVDTTALRAAIADLENIETTPSLFIPALSADVTAETDRVLGAISEQRAVIADAEAAKRAADAKAKAEAEAKAKAKAKAEAEAKAKAEREAAERASSSTSSGSSGSSASSSSSTPTVPKGTAQEIARQMVADRGWGEGEFSCLVKLWNKESGWRTTAENRSSGAYGIPQALPGSKMATAGSDWRTNPATQISWGLKYISGRYGSPCGAWGHSQSVGWY